MMNKLRWSLIFSSLFLFQITITNDQLQTYFQEHLINKKICLVLNPGNAGDALIWYGTYCFFNKMGIDYITSNKENDILSPNTDVVIYSGGGNLVPYYNSLALFLKKYMYKVKKLLILPHTIQGHEELLRQLPKSVIIFCRENMSYQYCKKIVPYPKNIYCAEDMAFYADLEDFKTSFNIPVNTFPPEFLAFRRDSEQNDARREILLPKCNVDFSRLGTIRPGDTVKKCKKTTHTFLSRIMPYKTIWTDRLHIGIAAFLLGKKVHLFDNSYGKNNAVYTFSIKPNDKTGQVIFYGTNFEPLKVKINSLNL